MRLFAPEWDPDATDVSFTPPHVFDALGLRFDLDPAAPPGGVPWVPADAFYTEADDGLLQPWHGRIWLNPPYSNPRPWIERFIAHRDGAALLPADTATGWFHEWVIQAETFCFLRGRLRFIREDAALETSARFPSLLIGCGSAAAAVRDCGLGWVP